MNVLLVGNGGRESAILQKILKSPLLNICYSNVIDWRNFSKKFVYTEVDVNDNDSVLSFCKQHDINFVIIGPELPLCNGIVDVLELHNIKAYGPNKAASELENSKIFMKDVLQSANVPTAKYQSFTENQHADAFNFLSKFIGKIVIKTDGLASGKGVYICENQQDAESVLKEFFAGKFGDAGKKVVIEEFLEGREVSIFALCDGKNAIPFFHACDYKKIGNGDTGLNTGGMGSFSPSFLKNIQFEEIVENYFNATLKELQNRGIFYKGFLFGGLIITKDGPKFLEYNVRMGDPETQSVMSILESDLLDILLKSHDGVLKKSDILFQDKSAITVVLASNGYPLDFEKGFEITIDNDISCNVFGSGIKKVGDKIFTNGGRVFSVTAVGKTIEEAKDEAYHNIEKIHFQNKYFRNDIGN